MAKKIIKEKRSTLRIECQAADRVPWKDLIPLQGDLKVMDPEDKAALRASLEEWGFSFPVHSWEDPKGKKKYVMDAHQRLVVISEMASEGWVIPDLPVAWVYAKNMDEAKKKLLAAASQYGRVTVGGLTKFIKVANVPVKVLPTMYRFPEIDMVKFQAAHLTPGTKEVSFTATDKKAGELDEDEFKDFEHTCPKCGFEFND